jgi:hypothetical protein
MIEKILNTVGMALAGLAILVVAIYHAFLGFIWLVPCYD